MINDLLLREKPTFTTGYYTSHILTEAGQLCCKFTLVAANSRPTGTKSTRRLVKRRFMHNDNKFLLKVMRTYAFTM